MMNFNLYLLARIRCDELLWEAEQERLVHQATQARTAKENQETADTLASFIRSLPLTSLRHQLAGLPLHKDNW